MFVGINKCCQIVFTVVNMCLLLSTCVYCCQPVFSVVNMCLLLSKGVKSYYEQWSTCALYWQHVHSDSMVTRIEIKNGTFMYVWNILRGINKAVT